MISANVLCTLSLHAGSHAAPQVTGLAESIARQLKTVEVVDTEVRQTAVGFLLDGDFWEINIGADVAHPDQLYGVIKLATLVRDMISGITLDVESIEVGADPTWWPS